MLTAARRFRRRAAGRSLRSAFAALLLALGSARLPAQVAAATAAKADDKVSDDELRIKGVFDSALPGTEQKNRLRFIIHPHFGDFNRRDYLRMPLGLRYGLTTRWEITGEVESYFSHGFGGQKWFEEYGFDNLHLGTKYRIGTRFWPGWDTGVGVDYQTPVGRPPPDVNDGLTHLSYYATFSHDLAGRPGWRFFWSAGADDVSTTGRPVTLQKNDLGDDAVNLSAGFVWQRGVLNYTFETSFATTRLTGTRDRDLVTIRPGVVWQVPKRYTFNSKGQWLLGLALRFNHGADGYDYGVSGKLRVSFDFKRWWRAHFSGKPGAAR